MAFISKSNAVYTGPEPLLGVKQVTYTPQEIFDEYKARVLADGGEIIDEARTLAAIQFAYSRQLFGRMLTIVGASYGLKRSGDNVLKLYGLDGIDFVAKSQTAWPQLDTSGAHPVIAVGHSTGNPRRYFVSESKLILSIAGRFGMVVAASDDITDSNQMTIGVAGGIGSGQSNYTLRVIFPYANEERSATIAVANSVWNPGGSTGWQTETFGAVAETDVLSLYGDTVEGYNVYGKNGDGGSERGSSFSSYFTTQPQTIFLGSLETNTTSANSSGFLKDFWLMRELGVLDPTAVAQFLHDFYAA